MQKSDKKESKNYSLKTRFTVFFVLFIVAVYSVVIITAAWQVVLVSETLGIQLGLPIVEEAARIIDGDAFEALSKSLDPEDPYYEKTRLELLAIKEKTKAVYLYTMARVEGGVFRYIIDGSAQDTDEGFSPLGTEEDISGYIDPVLKAMQTKTYQVDTDYSDWGWLISVFLPILNSSGEAVGVIGCDFVPTDIFTRLWSQIILEVVIAGVFALLGVAAYLYLVNGINRQNRRLVELKDAAEAASAALKEERDKVVIMKDRLLAEMRAFMELLSVAPEDFRVFAAETETRYNQVNAILTDSEFSPGEDLLEVHRNLRAMEEKAGQFGLKTFADRLGGLVAGIEKLRERPGVSSSDKAEILESLRKIMKALNDSRQIERKIQAFRSGDAQLKERGEA
ncbi:MAG: hypothetical protein LBT33_08820 [Spirochaetia bacterium]|jgi:hypothetical protein|nr:hypothetical protein [Spirochaetia bacterium]